MAWGFWESITFLGLQGLHKSGEKRKSKRMIEEEKYLETYSKLLKEIECINTLVETVFRNSTNLYSSLAGEGLQYVPLFCFSQVLNTQKQCYKNQKKLLTHYFEHMKVPFTLYEFINSSNTNIEIGYFEKTMKLNENEVGAFWKSFFRSVYKSNMQDEKRQVIEHLNNAILYFINIDDSSLREAKLDALLKRNIDNYEKHYKQIAHTTFDGIDIIGSEPIKSKTQRFLGEFKSIIEIKSDSTAETESFLTMMNLLLLNSICDIIMANKKPKDEKIEMIDYAVQVMGLKVDESPEEYVTHMAYRDEIGQMYFGMLSGIKPLGKFWRSLYDIYSHPCVSVDFTHFNDEITSILMQTESEIYMKFQISEKKSVALEYMINVVTLLLEEVKKGGQHG